MIRRCVLGLACAIVLTVSGCGGSKADELFETAQFEEKQNNREHARQLYEEIIKEYPDSTQAVRAKDRLEQLKPAAQ